MWIAENWKDYEVLDTSKGEKLERWGDYTLVRPDPQVIWDTPKTLRGWKRPECTLSSQQNAAAVSGNFLISRNSGVSTIRNWG